MSDQKLNKDVIRIFAEFLDTKTLLTYSRVNKNIHKFTEEIIVMRKLLQYIIEGMQDLAEDMLKSNPQLALGIGTVTDHVGRVFQDMSPLQLAMCSLDWHMWKMILQHMPEDAIVRDIEKFKINKNCQEKLQEIKGVFDSLVKEYQVYIDMPWDSAKCEHQWVKVIGGCQRQLPIQALQKYCNPDRPFYPCPSFNEDQFKRVAVGRNRAGCDGFEFIGLGLNFTLYRAGGFRQHATRVSQGTEVRWLSIAKLALDGDLPIPYIRKDCHAIARLKEVRVEQLNQLLATHSLKKSFVPS